VAVVSVENKAMQHICQKLGFVLRDMEDNKLLKAELTLS
jgi:RimJ/RimL family protein N-acetyltransferase